MWSDPLPEPERGDRQPGWHQCPAVIRAHREALDIMIDRAAAADYIGHDRELGIVIIGGGRYWLGSVISARMLREVGYTGPIQIWHGHYSDPEPIDSTQVAGLDVEIMPTVTHAGQHRPRILRGWEAKVYAVKHCGFKRLLMLDADAYCVNDPTRYWSRILDGHCGFAYWEDLPSTETNLKWHIVTDDIPARKPPAVQGGQLFIDRERAWSLIILVDWLCQHSDYYFQWGYGDQDCFRLALALLGDVTYELLGPARWVYPAFICSIYNNPIVVHRCQHKLFGVGYADPIDIMRGFNESLPEEPLIRQWYCELLGMSASEARLLIERRDEVSDALAQLIARYLQHRRQQGKIVLHGETQHWRLASWRVSEVMRRLIVHHLGSATMDVVDDPARGGGYHAIIMDCTISDGQSIVMPTIASDTVCVGYAKLGRSMPLAWPDGTMQTAIKSTYSVWLR